MCADSNPFENNFLKKMIKLKVQPIMSH